MKSYPYHQTLYLFLRNSYLCQRGIFIFDTDQAQNNSAYQYLIYSIVGIRYIRSLLTLVYIPARLQGNCEKMPMSLLFNQ